MSSITEQVIERLKELRDQMRYYGLLMGGALVLIELLQYWQHNHMSISSGMLILVFKVTTMFVIANNVVKRIKPEFFKGGLTYSQSFSLIFRLFIYGSLLVGLYSFVLNKWIAPEHLSTVLENSVASIRSYIATAQVPEMQMEYIEEIIEKVEESPIPSPLSAMWNQMWSYIVWGAFVGVILSFFTRDKDIRPFTENTAVQ